VVLNKHNVNGRTTVIIIHIYLHFRTNTMDTILALNEQLPFHKRRSNLTMCLGMTLYNRSSVEKTELGLSAAHVLADILTNYDGVSEIEYPGIETQQDIDNLIRLMHGISLQDAYIPNYISILHQLGIDTNMENELVTLSTQPEFYVYDPKSVVLHMINPENPFLPRTGTRVLEYIDLSSFSSTSSTVLGAGSFATVHLWNNIAIKVIVNIGDDYDFLKEISALVALSESPDVVRFMGSSISGDSALIATEVGVSDMHGKFTPAQIKHEWLVSLLRGLAYMHNLDIIHTDIKPANLLLMPDNRVVIADLGSCLLYSSMVRKDQRGSYNYMDHALLTGSSDFSYEIDVWSAACTILDFLSGMYPYFRGNTSQDIPGIIRDMESKILTETPLSDVNLTTSMRELLTMMLDTNPKTRISTVGSLLTLTNME
jgi:hypothetical protein